MKRRQGWLRWFLSALLLAVIWFSLLTWFVPGYVTSTLQRLSRHRLAVDSVRVYLPATITLLNVHSVPNTARIGLSVPRIVIKPWLFLPWSRKLLLQSVRIEHPIIRVTRAADETLRWPSIVELPALTGNPPLSSKFNMGGAWTLHADALTIIGGTFEFLDEVPKDGFHGAIDHLFLEAGSVSIPPKSSKISIAVRGEIIGDKGRSAPFYCSGWYALGERSLEASCQLEPLALSAFEPYFVGSPRITVYSATVQSTSQWKAISNDLDAQIQLELGHLEEGDVSIRGRTIFDVKKLTKEGEEPRLSGEINITGPLDNPSQWHARLVPGNFGVQGLIERLIDRGIEVVKFPLWGRRVGVSMIPASKAVMRGINAVSKEISEALEVLAVPSEEVIGTAGERAIEALPEVASPLTPQSESKQPASTTSEPEKKPAPTPAKDKTESLPSEEEAPAAEPGLPVDSSAFTDTQ